MDLQDEVDMTQAIDDALETIEQVKTDDYREEPAARSLIKRSKASFAKNLEQLEAQVQSAQAAIIQSVQARDDAIAMAAARHNAFVAEVELDLYQVKTVKAALELAIAVLPHE